MSGVDTSQFITTIPGGVALRVKVVPGASRTGIAGVLGDRLKVAVSAAPEGGKANKAVCALLAQIFGVATRDVVVTEGQARPRKTIEIPGINLCQAVERVRDILSAQL